MRLIVICLFISLSLTFGMKDVPCGKESGQSCPDGDTCCDTTSGIYGCCPLPNASCCSDKKHCCPNGYKCDLAHHNCVKQMGHIGLFSSIGKMESLTVSKFAPKVKDIDTCVKDVQIVVQDAGRIFKDIQSQDFNDLVEAVNQLVQDLQQAIKDCEEVVHENEKHGNISDCIRDVQSIIKDAENLYNDYQAKDYQKMIQDAVSLANDGMNAQKDCNL